jgi:hypothetical protein
VPSFHANAGIRKRARQFHFDARRFATFDMLQVKRWTRQHLDAALQHTAGSADSGLVLIETVRGRVSGHADIHTVVITASIGKVQQDEIDVRSAAATGGEARGNVVRGG